MWGISEYFDKLTNSSLKKDILGGGWGGRGISDFFCKESESEKKIVGVLWEAGVRENT